MAFRCPTHRAVYGLPHERLSQGIAFDEEKANPDAIQARFDGIATTLTVCARPSEGSLLRFFLEPGLTGRSSHVLAYQLLSSLHCRS